MRKRSIKSSDSQTERALVELYQIILEELLYLEGILQDNGIDYKVNRNKETPT